MIQIQMYNGQTKINVNMAIKVVPHVFHEGELRLFVTDVLEFGHPLAKLIRLSSGEISFWRDFVLNEKKLERDKVNYKKYNRHPWFRQMRESKFRRQFRALLRLAFPAFVAKGEVLPTATIVLTSDEFNNAFGTGIDILKRRPEKITKFMDQLMLLGFIVLDNERGIVHAKYSGFDDWEMYHLKDLLGKKEDDDVNKQLVKTINTMMRRM